MIDERKRALRHLDIALYYNSQSDAVEAVRRGTPADDTVRLHRLYADIETARNAQRWDDYGEYLERLYDM